MEFPLFGMVSRRPECSLRSNLDSGSAIPRFDATLGDRGSPYTNPFTGETGTRKIGTHIPLDSKYY